MSLPFELCPMIPNAVAIASRMALPGVLTIRCMQVRKANERERKWKMERRGKDGVVLGSIL